LMLIMRGKRLGFSIAEIREVISMYKEPPGESGQLKLLIQRVIEKPRRLPRIININKRRSEGLNSLVLPRLIGCIRPSSS